MKFQVATLIACAGGLIGTAITVYCELRRLTR